MDIISLVMAKNFASKTGITEINMTDLGVDYDTFIGFSGLIPESLVSLLINAKNNLRTIAVVFDAPESLMKRKVLFFQYYRTFDSKEWFYCIEPFVSDMTSRLIVMEVDTEAQLLFVSIN